MSGSNVASSSSIGVCRDYQRGVCDRGNRCKFVHAIDTSFRDSQDEDRNGYGGGGGGGSGSSGYTFCHAFSSRSGCNRGKCRYIHCSREDEEEFKRSGYMSPTIKHEIMSKGLSPKAASNMMMGGGGGGFHSYNNNGWGGGSATTGSLVSDNYGGWDTSGYGSGSGGSSYHTNASSSSYDQRPVCKDNMYNPGGCKRGASCKYRHDNADASGGGANMGASPRKMAKRSAPTGGHSSRTNGGGFDDENSGGKGEKQVANESEILLLKQQNKHLTETVSSLEAQVDKLQTTNNFLLDQNAQLRMMQLGGGGGNGGSCGNDGSASFPVSQQGIIVPISSASLSSAALSTATTSYTVSSANSSISSSVSTSGGSKNGGFSLNNGSGPSATIAHHGCPAVVVGQDGQPFSGENKCELKTVPSTAATTTTLIAATPVQLQPSTLTFTGGHHQQTSGGGGGQQTAALVVAPTAILTPVSTTGQGGSKKDAVAVSSCEVFVPPRPPSTLYTAVSSGTGSQRHTQVFSLAPTAAGTHTVVSQVPIASFHD